MNVRKKTILAVFLSARNSVKSAHKFVQELVIYVNFLK